METLPSAGSRDLIIEPPPCAETKDGPVEVPVRELPTHRRCERELQSAFQDTFGIVGTILDGRYHVERAVGQGGFGVVYRARHVAFDAPVAIKVLRVPDGLTSGKREEFVRSFLSEGKVLFELGSLHPAIIRALETGTVMASDGAVAPYLALEWLEGISLERELEARRQAGVGCYSVNEALSLLARAVEGIGLAHDRGVAHRDIKPGNIFLSVSEGVSYAKVLDFGLAKIMADTSSVTQMLADTTGGQTPFTPAYGAPEQWLRRLGATGPWTDVYALALVFVELVCGRRALAGEDAHQLMAASLDAACRPTPRTLGVNVTDAIEAVMAKALAVDPRNRYRNASSFWLALCEAAAWSPLHADPCRVIGAAGASCPHVRIAGGNSDTDSGARSSSGVAADSNLSSMQPVSGKALSGSARRRPLPLVLDIRP